MKVCLRFKLSVLLVALSTAPVAAWWQPPGVVLAPARNQVDHRLLAAEGIDRKLHKQVDGRGRTVEVQSSAEEVVVTAAAGDRIEARASLQFWSNDDVYTKKVEDEFDIVVEESSSRVRFVVELPPQPTGSRLKRLFKSNQVHYSLTLELSVPPSTPLELTNRYGDVRVDGVGGALRLVNNGGKVEVEGAVGEVELENRYGDVRIVDVDGPLRATVNSGRVTAHAVSGETWISNRYGDVEVEDVGKLEVEAQSGNVQARQVRGAARIRNTYGDIEIAGVAGALSVDSGSANVQVEDVGRTAEIATTYGSVRVLRVSGDLEVRAMSSSGEIRDVGGALRYEGSYGDLVVERVEGSAQIDNGSGAVTATDVRGRLDVDCSYATVRASGVGGPLTVDANSTAVHVEDVAGSVEVRTSYAGVRVAGVGGAVSVRNQSGAVVVRGLSAGALTARHSVETTYADIEFEWPVERGVSFTLESTYGRIDSALKGAMRESGSRRTLSGSHGDGAAELRLVSQSGSVTVTGG